MAEEKYPWTQIQDTNLGIEVFCNHIVENTIHYGLKYHNYKHVIDMYEFLEKNNVPYDPVLDWAILFHDAVYDSKPEKEKRSAELFVELSKTVERSGCNLTDEQKDQVYSLIMKTATHELSEDFTIAELLIIMADLHALTDKRKAIENFAKIMSESMNLYGCPLEEFAENNITFMNGLRDRLTHNVYILEEKGMHDEVQFFLKVIDYGISLTTQIAKGI